MNFHFWFVVVVFWSFFGWLFFFFVCVFVGFFGWLRFFWQSWFQIQCFRPVLIWVIIKNFASGFVILIILEHFSHSYVLSNIILFL